MSQRLMVDGNEAVTRVAYAASEVIAIYPIPPRLPDGRVIRRMGRRRQTQRAR